MGELGQKSLILQGIFELGCVYRVGLGGPVESRLRGLISRVDWWEGGAIGDRMRDQVRGNLFKRTLLS